MKYRIIPLVLVLILVGVSCGNRNQKGLRTDGQASDTGKASITFTSYEHDFGKVSQGEKVSTIFTFTNTGTSPLVINSATTSCGCTVSKYDRKPIIPGGTGNMEVVFNTEGRNGLQTKTITVNSNARQPVVLLRITAEVINNNNNK